MWRSNPNVTPSCPRELAKKINEMGWEHLPERDKRYAFKNARQILASLLPESSARAPLIEHIEDQLKSMFPDRKITFQPPPANPPRSGKLALIEKIKASKRMKQIEETNNQ
jgi:hypothetical protein